MCVVNKQFEILEYVLIPFMLTCNMMRFISLLLLGLSHCVVYVVMWSSLVRLRGFRGNLCEFGGLCDCDS